MIDETKVTVEKLVTPSEKAAIVSRFIVPIVLTPMPCDPLVLMPLLIVVIVLTHAIDCSIISHSYYCIVTLIVLCYVLPSTGLVLIVACIFLYSLSRVSCQYRTSTRFTLFSGLRRAQIIFHSIQLALYHLEKAIVCYPTCTAAQYTIV